ncbi:MAG: hypothetical protein RIQ89_866 [Bacteroidota bacterium]|jgi:hypothetical protein
MQLPEKEIVHIKSFVGFIKQHRNFFAAAFLVVFIATGLVLRFNFVYKAFVVLDYQDPVELKLNGEKGFLINNGEVDNDYYKFYRLIFSDEMFGHLIKTFSLFDHYQLDSKNEFHQGIIKKILQQNIVLSQSDKGVTTLTVKDKKDGAVAAHIANEIPRFANELNRKWRLEQLNFNKPLFDTIYLQSKKELRNELHTLSNQIEGLIAQLEIGNESNNLERMALNGLIAKMEKSLDDEVNIIRQYSMLTAASKFSQVPVIITLQGAVPDLGYYNFTFWQILLIACGAAVFATVLVIYIGYHTVPYYNAAVKTKA